MVQSVKMWQICGFSLDTIWEEPSVLLNKGGKSNKLQNEKKQAEKELYETMAPYSADILNPFELRRPLTMLQLLKSIILSVTLLPVRLLFMTALLLVAWMICKVTLIGLPQEQAACEEPLSGWRRRWAKPLISSIMRCVFFIGGWYWIPHKGRRATAKEAPILLAMPHSSFLDTIVVNALDCPSLVVKDSTERTPFFGSLVKYTQPFFVKTEDPESRRLIAERIRKRAISGKDFEQLLIFPEAGCGNRKSLLQFKLGGFAPGVPVQPVFIRYKNNLDTVTWTWDGPGALEQMWLTLTQFRICLELEFLPVYVPKENEDTRGFAENVQSHVSSYAGIPVSRFSLEDAKYLLQAKEQKLPLTAALVKFIRLRKSIGQNEMEPTVELEHLKNGNRFNTELRGTVDEMASYLKLKRCPEALRDFFHLMDQHKTGLLDFQTYDAGLHLLRKDINTKAKLKAALEAFSTKNEVEHLESILLLWRGVPYSISKLKNFDLLNKNEKELYITY